MKNEHYLDHNATTPPLPAVVEACARAMGELYGNPSSVHQTGQAAKNALEAARAAVAGLIGAIPREIVLVSGATEANQLAIRGAMAARAEACGGAPVVITSAVEHPSVWGAAELAASATGGRHLKAPVDARGRLELDALEALLEANAGRVAVVSVMRVQNELGNRYPVDAVSRLARRAGALVHTDATQAVGRIPVDVDALGVDLLSLSGHKFGGPKGAGALFVRRGVTVEAVARGGHQERGRRPGTECVWALVGLGKACEVASSPGGLDGWARATEMARALGSAIQEALPAAMWLGDAPEGTGNTVCVSLPGIPADTLLMALDLEGVAVSAGSACSSGSLEPSPALEAMGVEGAVARSAVRLSTGPQTDAETVAAVVAALKAQASYLGDVAEDWDPLKGVETWRT